MTGVTGIRVMRGPHWDQGDVDGGEGHLGTVRELLGDGLVRVLWDKGQQSVCRAGADGKFDLRVFDNAQAGIRHPNTRCAECGESHIYGMLWRCQDCSQCDLCPLCYGDDRHDIRHRFMRVDHYKSEGESVKKRKVSVRMRSMGIFPGAKVIRGQDWSWGDQDGGPGSEGEVQAFENVAPDSSRNLVRVQWLAGRVNSYRMGFHGSVDLLCVEEEVGPFYYRDHLPWLDASKLPYPLAPQDAFTSQASTTTTTTTTSTDKASSSSSTATSPSDSATTTTISPVTSSSDDVPPPSAQRQPMPDSDQLSQSSSLSPATQTPPPPSVHRQDGDGDGGDSGAVAGAYGGDDGAMEVAAAAVDQEADEVRELPLTVGDEVVIGVNENMLRDLQEDYGGVTQKMIQKLGQKGVVTEMNSGVVVQFGSSAYRMNPLALVKVSPLKEGDVVRIRRDVRQVKLLNRNIAWNQQMAETCGSIGRVQMVHKDDSVTVNFGHYQTFRFSSACCVPAPSATPDPLGTLAQARRAAVAGMEQTETETHRQEAASGGHLPGGVPASAVLGKGVMGRMAPPVGVGGATLADQDGKGLGARVIKLVEGGKRSESVAVFQNCGDAGTKLGDKQNSGSDSDSDMQKTVMRMLGMLKSSDSDDDNGSTDPQLKILFSVIARGDTRSVETMVRANRSLLVKTEQTLTPLMYACHKGQQEVVRTLLDLGADVNGVGGKGRTPLLIAINSEKENVALMLLERGANPNTANDRMRSALHAAAFGNLTQIAQVLISMGADINAKDNVQDTPLFDAIEQGHEAMVEVLLQIPSLNVHDLNSHGFNMLHLTCLHGKPRMVELILARDPHPGINELLTGEYSALHIAANNDHVECIGILVLIGGATIDIPDGRRRLTPLHLACKRRQFKAAEALIGLGASVNASDLNGNTPLHLAMGKRLENNHDDADVTRSTAIEQRTQVACLLLSRGALTDVMDDEGRPPLSYGHKEVQVNVELYLGNVGVSLPAFPGKVVSGHNITSEVAPMAPGMPKAKTVGEGTTCKQDDVQHLNSLLRGVSIQCMKCNAMSDVTLQPCGHKTVCRKCCDTVSVCPQCGQKVEEAEADNTDDPEEDEQEEREKQNEEVDDRLNEKQEEEEEEWNKFD